MPGFADELTADQIAAVAAYAASLQTSNPTTTTTTTLAPTASGTEIYAAKCAVCHGADGEGGEGPSLLNLPETTERLIEIINRGPDDMPGFADELTADQIAAVAELVAGFAAGPAAGYSCPAPASDDDPQLASIVPSGDSDGGGLKANIGLLLVLIAIVAFIVFQVMWGRRITRQVRALITQAQASQPGDD